MNERKILWAGCRRDPTDGVRLGVFSDWIEEHDEPEEAAGYRRIADHLRGEPDSPPVMEGDRLLWLELLGADCSRVVDSLDRANGRRRERTLDLSDVLACAVRAWGKSGKGLRWAFAEGGRVANAYSYPAYQTVCLAVRFRGRVTVRCEVASARKGASVYTPFGLSSARAKPVEFQAWAVARRKPVPQEATG